MTDDWKTREGVELKLRAIDGHWLIGIIYGINYTGRLRRWHARHTRPRSRRICTNDIWVTGQPIFISSWVPLTLPLQYHEHHFLSLAFFLLLPICIQIYIHLTFFFFLLLSPYIFSFSNRAGEYEIIDIRIIVYL